MPLLNKEEKFRALVSEFKYIYGAEPLNIQRLAASGGDRQYFRLSMPDGSGCVGVYGENVFENRCFIELAGMFASRGIRVPEILAVGDDSLTYLCEDLGDISLFSLLKSDTDAPRYVAAALKSLAHLQCVDSSLWTDIVKNAPFCRRQVLWDLYYFKYEFLKTLNVDFDEERLEDDFESLAQGLLDVDPSCTGFMYRDCQSRNVMIHDDVPCWIDFQGGRLGPLVYDVVSFLWQAKAGFSDDFRKEMLEVYASELAGLRGGEARIEILRSADKFALFRTLQVLGAYGYRGLIQRRAHFIESIPGALANIRKLVDKGVVDAYPELKRVCAGLCLDKRFESFTSDALTVEVYSFSYKKGYPEDFSGNGGGFMFDCRGMHNPGRYAEYRQLTGRDRAVKDFLEEKGEVQLFTRRSFDMVGDVVERYLQRGFSKLQVGFGCTGGRHRSVYCAEAVAGMVKARFPECRVVLRHREQDIEVVL